MGEQEAVAGNYVVDFQLLQPILQGMCSHIFSFPLQTSEES